MLLQGKKTFVTGGSRGIGKEIVLAFLRQGADVYFTSTNPSPHLDEIEAAARESGTKAVWKQGDVTDEAAVGRIVDEIVSVAGSIDVVVNNAGITRDGLVFRMPLADWNEVLAVNLTSAFLVSRAASRQMIKQRSGSIISVSSIVGVIGNAGQTNYAASKAGLIGFSKSLAREVAGRGVRVNVIAPGFIRTAMTDNLKDDIKEKLKTQIPLGRIGEPREIADVAVFLASDMASYVTGQVILADGGMGM